MLNHLLRSVFEGPTCKDGLRTWELWASSGHFRRLRRATALGFETLASRCCALNWWGLTIATNSTQLGSGKIKELLSWINCGEWVHTNNKHQPETQHKQQQTINKQLNNNNKLCEYIDSNDDAVIVIIRRSADDKCYPLRVIWHVKAAICSPFLCTSPAPRVHLCILYARLGPSRTMGKAPKAAAKKGGKPAA